MGTERPQSRIKISKVKIIKRQNFTPDLWVIWIEKPNDFHFKAGQYCTIGSSGTERAYSIVSAPHEESLELFIELVPPPEGILTPKLWELSEGDSVSIRPRAKGVFTFKPAFRDQLLVSTVTGVVPYISFLRDYIYQGHNGHHFYVLQGASYTDEFVYDHELQDLAEKYPNMITYIPTISRPKEANNQGWEGETGRVNEICKKYLDQYGLQPDGTLIYACGHPDMIEDVKSRFIPIGFKVEEERFWKQD